MKRGIWISAACAVIILGVLGLISCDTADDVPPVEMISFGTEYAVICPENDPTVPSGFHGVFYRKLSEICPGMTLTDDFYREKSEISPQEILVGATNRPESDIAFTSPDEFVVQVVGEKLVIHSASVLGLDRACQVALEQLTAGGMRLPKDFSYTGNLEDAEEKQILVADQCGGRLSVYDVSRGFIEESDRVWSLRPAESRIAGLKYRDTDAHGQVVLCAAGDYYAAMYSYPAGELLWQTRSAANNPHSIDISQDGSVIAVASSAGNEVRFYQTSDTTDTFVSLPYEDAHGVLYDPTEDCFWVAGMNRLGAYRVSVGKSGWLTVQAIEDKQYTCPESYLHDLQPCAGEAGDFWLSCAQVYRFDRDTGEFSTKYDNRKYINYASVKGISSFADGSVVLVYPDGAYKSWTSGSVVCSYILPFTGVEVFVDLELPKGAHVYKVRAFESAYCP